VFLAKYYFLLFIHFVCINKIVIIINKCKYCDNNINNNRNSHNNNKAAIKINLKIMKKKINTQPIV